MTDLVPRGSDPQVVAWMRDHIPTLPRYFGTDSARLVTIRDYRDAHPNSKLRLEDLTSAYVAASAGVGDRG
jgi:hypothetical protein